MQLLHGHLVPFLVPVSSQLPAQHAMQTAARIKLFPVSRNVASTLTWLGCCSHLQGMFFRTGRLLEAGMKPVYAAAQLMWLGICGQHGGVAQCCCAAGMSSMASRPRPRAKRLAAGGAHAEAAVSVQPWCILEAEAAPLTRVLGRVGKKDVATKELADAKEACPLRMSLRWYLHLHQNASNFRKTDSGSIAC